MEEHKDYEETMSSFERVGGNKETQKWKFLSSLQQQQQTKA